MKKRITGVLFSILFTMISFPAFAAGNASFLFKTDAYSVQVGETFDVPVLVNPNGEQLNTVRAVLTFDPTVLQAQWATLTGSLERSAPGNYFDNTKGVVSWAGFSTKESFFSEGDFAKVTFTAIKDGNSQVKISTDSHLISNGEEKFGGVEVSAAVKVVPATMDPNSGIFTVDSSSHPVETNWYQKNTVDVRWVELESRSPIKSYFYTFDETPNSDPQKKLSSTEKSFQQKNVSDGMHFFHLKAVQQDGSVTPTIHRRVQVDTTLPNQIVLSAQTNTVLEGESVWLTFATTDETSGVLEYQVSMDNSVFQTQQSPLEITDLKPGTYFFRVAALDRAGNTIYGSSSVRVYPKGTMLDRPAGFASGSEEKILMERGKEVIRNSAGKKQSLLIILVLVVALGFGIIYSKKISLRGRPTSRGKKH